MRQQKGSQRQLIRLGHVRPSCLRNLGRRLRFERMGDVEQLGHDDTVGLVCSLSFEAPKGQWLARRIRTDFFSELPEQRFGRGFRQLDLSARKHEAPCVCLSDEQYVAGAIVYDGCGDMDCRYFRQRSSPLPATTLILAVILLP
jgi:hypothetical protein